MIYSHQYELGILHAKIKQQIEESAKEMENKFADSAYRIWCIMGERIINHEYLENAIDAHLFFQKRGLNISFNQLKKIERDETYILNNGFKFNLGEGKLYR